jgi:hypothetical protein
VVSVMKRIADCGSLEELQGFTDADIPSFKRLFVDMRREGNPLQLPPSVATAAIAKGFEEGVHFDIVRPIPRAGVHG